MLNKYEKWIEENVEETGYGQCAEVTKRMQEAFPELIRIRGHYNDWLWGMRDHWWLAIPGGEIIDPTCAQFPTKGNAEYIPWKEGNKEPIGKCPNCGEWVMEETWSGACSKECEQDYRKYIESL